MGKDLQKEHELQEETIQDIEETATANTKARWKRLLKKIIYFTLELNTYFCLEAI